MAKITSKANSVAKTIASTVKKNAAAASVSKAAPKPAAATKTVTPPPTTSHSSRRPSTTPAGGTPGVTPTPKPATPTAPALKHDTSASAMDAYYTKKRSSTGARSSAGGTASRSIGSRTPNKPTKFNTNNRMK